MEPSIQQTQLVDMFTQIKLLGLFTGTNHKTVIHRDAYKLDESPSRNCLLVLGLTTLCQLKWLYGID
jgi:hypothetical protein